MTTNGDKGKSKVQPVVRVGTVEESPKPDDAKQIAALNEELATYLYYCVTVMQFFSDVLNTKKMERAEKEKVFDDLARARQFLAINASITRAMLNKFRDSFGMEVPSFAVVT